MLDYGFANYALISPQLPPSSAVPVKLGTEEAVQAVPGEDSQLLIDKAQANTVTTEITLDESVSAPVSKGQRLGTMTVKAGEQVLAQVPMVAQKAVGRLTFWDLFWQVFRLRKMSISTVTAQSTRLTL